MPRTIAPMLAVSSGTLPKDSGKWAFEFKWNGVRALCFWDGKNLRLQSRNKLDITRRYPELQDLAKSLPRSGVVLDGEIIALDAKCQPSFNLLQYRMHAEGAATIAKLATTIPVWYVLFDVLRFRGKSVMDLPFTDRRQILEDLKLEGPAWQTSPEQVDNGSAMLNVAKRNGLEGVVAKRRQPLPAGPPLTELAQGQGHLRPGIHHRRLGPGKRREPGAGRFPADRLPRQPRPASICRRRRAGFNAALHASVTRELKKRSTKTNPFVDRVPKKDVLFVKPELVAEVEYRRWPDGAQVQQAAFKGLHSDKSAKEIIRETRGA